MNSNPLSQYFRQPAVYIKLPSQGKFYPAHSLEMPPNSELPVYPMTTLDEITYRIPDALFNGSAVVSVIESCVPNIKDAWQVPNTDLDTLLIAIRLATYGHELDIDTKCPNCETENSYSVDLRRILEKISTVDYDKPMVFGDLEIYLKPLNYRDVNDNNLTQFEEQKMLQSITAAEGDDASKSQQLGEMLKKVTQVTIRALAKSIALVKTPTARVTELEYIQEWLNNCDRQMFAAIRDQIIQSKQRSEIPPLDLQCPECSHKYQQVFTMNMTDFFGDAS
jgi:hypothetical protein